MHLKRLFVPIGLAIIALFLYSFAGNNHPEKTIPQSQNSKGGTELPMGYNDLFAGSGECVLCHDNLVTEGGTPVSITNDWRSTMMGNAARDPLWRAKVSHEVLVNPDLQEIIENKCTKCHAPAGNKNAHFLGQEYYSIADMTSDPLALDGVQCSVCHQITEASLGNFSGEFIVGENKQIWGPYVDPFTNPMISHTGYTPVYSNHIEDSKLCGSCHTLLTPTVDLNGVPTGGEFVEQAIYHEWENSDFPENNISCQKCHIPHIDDPIAISTMPPWLDARTPFGLHHFAGANVFMQKILKDNAIALGLTVEPAQFDSTIARNYRKLQNETLMLDIEELNRTDNILSLDVTLKNMAGHKFPAGFPSRRTFIELYALSASGDTLFHSGKMDENYNLIAENTEYEDHYDVINNEDQVQIYEIVMGDVNGDPTTILLYAAAPIKDNRLPPVGFSSAHPNYDTVLVAGDALIDPDFNKIAGQEGSGKDVVHFQIPINGYAGEIEVKAKVWYKTMPEKWLQSMFAHSSTEIDLFKSMYEDADKQPILVNENSLVSAATGMNNMINQPEINVYPNPTSGRLYFDQKNHLIEQVTVFSNDGKVLKMYDPGKNEVTSYIDLPKESNIYFVRLSGTSFNFVKKIIVL